MWTKPQVVRFIKDHPIDTSWKDGYQMEGKPFSKVMTVTHEDGYGTDIHHEIKLLSNLRHCPQHTLLTVLWFMWKAVNQGDVTIWNHPKGKIHIMFQEQVNPGP